MTEEQIERLFCNSDTPNLQVCPICENSLLEPSKRKLKQFIKQLSKTSRRAYSKAEKGI